MDEGVEFNDPGDVVNFPQGYSVLIEKACSEDIKLVSWCSTMDLIALAFVDNTVNIHRLNWQKVISLPLEDGIVVTALEWRPDGMSR